MNMNREKTILVSLTICMVLLFRWLPHPPNFTPIIGLSIMSATLFKSKKSHFLFPLLLMFVTDVFIGFHTLMPFVYGAILVTTTSGYILKKHTHITTAIGCSLLSSIIFFLISNVGVWMTGTLYAKSMTGLIQCFTAAIPFFHNTVLSTVLFVGVIVSIYKLLKQTNQTLSSTT